jgi:hypothetical protein
MPDLDPPKVRWKLLAWAGAALAGVSAVAQLLGALMTGAKIIPWSVAICAGGAGALFGAEWLWRSGRLRRLKKAKSIFLIMLALLAGAAGGYVLSYAVNSSNSRSATGPSDPASKGVDTSTTPPVTSGSPTPSDSSEPSQSSTPDAGAKGSVVILKTGGLGVESTVDIKVVALPDAGKYILMVRFAGADTYLYKRAGDVPMKIGPSQIRYSIDGSSNCSWRDFAVFHVSGNASPVPGPDEEGSADVPPGYVNLTGWHPHQRKDDPSRKCP